MASGETGGFCCVPGWDSRIFVRACVPLRGRFRRPRGRFCRVYPSAPQGRALAPPQLTTQRPDVRTRSFTASFPDAAGGASSAPPGPPPPAPVPPGPLRPTRTARSGEAAAPPQGAASRTPRSPVGEPPRGSCAERFIRTLKEQCIWSRAWETIEELREGVRAFVELSNTRWLIERHGHRTPREAYLAATAKAAA